MYTRLVVSKTYFATPQIGGLAYLSDAGSHGLKTDSNNRVIL